MRFINLFFIFIFIQCNSKDSSLEEGRRIDIENYNLKIDDQINSDSTEIIKTCKNFLLWYRDNFSRIDSIQLVPSSKDSDLYNYYYVDTVNLKIYLDIILSSNLVSENYISSLKEYIFSCDKKMRESNQNDGPPEGLDFDLILSTQEVRESLNKIREAKPFIFTLEENKSVVSIILAYELRFTLIKIDYKWVIDS